MMEYDAYSIGAWMTRDLEQGRDLEHDPSYFIILPCLAVWIPSTAGSRLQCTVSSQVEWGKHPTLQRTG